jgi:hypothetical protein
MKEESKVFHSTTYHGALGAILIEEENWFSLYIRNNDGTRQSMTIYKCKSIRTDNEEKENEEE